MLTKTFRKLKVSWDTIASAIIAFWALRTAQPPNIEFSVPIEIASDATVLAEETEVVISAEGVAIVTVTPTPDPTNLQGYVGDFQSSCKQ